MIKKLIYLFLFLSIFTCVSATTIKSDVGDFKVTYPDVVNPFEPVILHFEIEDKEIIDNADFMNGQFSIPLSEGEGFSHKSDLPLGEFNHYQYSGEKSFDIAISLYVNGALDLNNKEDYVEEKSDFETSREITFHSETDGVLGRIKIPIVTNSYKFDVKAVPSGFVKEVDDLNTLSIVYDKPDSGMSNYLGLGLLALYTYLDSGDKTQLSLDDLEKPLTQRSWIDDGVVNIPEGYVEEKFVINSYPAKLYTYCEISGWEEADEFRSECSFSGQIITEIGVIDFNMRRSTGSDKESKVAAEARVEEWKAFAKDNFMNIIFDGGETSDSEEEGSIFVSGYLVNKDKNPLPYMLVEIFVNNKKEASGYTDLNGNYELELKDLSFGKEDELNSTIAFSFDYTKDGEKYFELYDYNASANNYHKASMWKKITLTPNSNLELNLDIDGGRNVGLKCNFGSHISMKDFAVIYYGMHESVEFATEKLFQKLDHKLPVEVYIGKDDNGTYYSPGDSIIYIAKSDESSSSSDNPRNREYHEFGHHLMYDVYGSWTGDAGMRGVINHGGFINPTTADSFDEGFAEYTALCVAKYLGYKDADIYAGFGSMEDNYKPWDARGSLEEFAVASLLWDMIDSKNEPGDSLTMSIEDVWRVIGVKQADVFGYYKAFVKRFPDKEDAFDELFILHGFFADNEEGNGEWDRDFEPFRDVNRNRQVDSSDIFVDLSCEESPCEIDYEEGMVVGQATNFDRPDRSQAVRIENSYIEVDVEGPRFYKITVDYEDLSRESYSYQVEARGGLVYVHPRPEDTMATITIEPETLDFSYEKPFVISNTELIEHIYLGEENEYIAKPDFGLKNLNTNNDLEMFEDGFEPRITNDLGRFEKKNDKRVDSGFGASNDSGSFFFELLSFLVLIILFYFYIKKPIVKKYVDNIFRKIANLLKRFSTWFKENYIPTAVKFSKLVQKWIKTILRFVFDYSKKIYCRLKPYVKKNYIKIKAKISELKKKLDKINR